MSQGFISASAYRGEGLLIVPQSVDEEALRLGDEDIHEVVAYTRAVNPDTRSNKISIVSIIGEEFQTEDETIGGVTYEIRRRTRSGNALSGVAIATAISDARYENVSHHVQLVDRSKYEDVLLFTRSAEYIRRVYGVSGFIIATLPEPKLLPFTNPDRQEGVAA